MELITQQQKNQTRRRKNLFNPKNADFILALVTIILLAITVFYGFPGPAIK